MFGDHIGNKFDDIILTNIYILLPISIELDDSELTYPLLAYSEALNIECDTFQGDDGTYILPIKHVFYYKDFNIILNPSLLRFLKKNYGFSKKHIHSKIKNKIIFYVNTNVEALNNINANVLNTRLLKFNVSKIYFENISIDNLYLSLTSKIQTHFSNCDIREMIGMSNGIDSSSNVYFDYCQFGLLVHKKPSNKNEDTLNISNCSINYLITEANNIYLKNISEIYLIVFINTANLKLTIDNISIKYDWKKIIKYYDYSSSILPGIKDDQKLNKSKSIIQNYITFYFSNINEYIPGKFYNNKTLADGKNGQMFIIEKGEFKFTLRYFIYLAKRILKFWKFEKQKLPYGSYKFVKDGFVAYDMLNRYPYSINYISNQNGLLNTCKFLLSQNISYSDKISIDRYLHYINSRTLFIKKLAYWFNGGYYKILTPLSFFIITVSINVFLISKINTSNEISPIVFAVNFVKLFNEVLFKNFIFSPIRIFYTILIIIIQAMTIYSFFSLSIAIKRRFGFPKDYE